MKLIHILHCCRSGINAQRTEGFLWVAVTSVFSKVGQVKLDQVESDEGRSVARIAPEFSISSGWGPCNLTGSS